MQAARSEEKRMEKFIAGLALGAAMGALWVANSAKTRTLVKKGQEEFKEKLDAYIDEKLASMDMGKSGQEENESSSQNKASAK